MLFDVFSVFPNYTLSTKGNMNSCYVYGYSYADHRSSSVVKDDAATFTVDLPGVPKAEVRIEVEYISGVETLCIYRGNSKLNAIRLPSSCDIGGITASLVDGRLTVTAPRIKKESVKINIS